MKVPVKTEAQGETVYRLNYSGQPSNFKDIDFDLFWAVWDLLDENYYQPEEMNGEKMVDGAIAGMVSGLDDPYTVYLPAEYNKINVTDAIKYNWLIRKTYRIYNLDYAKLIDSPNLRETNRKK